MRFGGVNFVRRRSARLISVLMATLVALLLLVGSFTNLPNFENMDGHAALQFYDAAAPSPRSLRLIQLRLASHSSSDLEYIDHAAEDGRKLLTAHTDYVYDGYDTRLGPSPS